MTTSNKKPERAIFKTLKAVTDSTSALSVKDIEGATDFNMRTLQRHLDELSDIGLISRVNKGLDQGKGYLYIRNINFIS